MGSRLRSIAYEPPGEESLFDRWEAGVATDVPAPLAVRDPEYRAAMVRIARRYRHVGRRLVSIGAGTGHVEAAFAADGWDVLATDPAASALRICRAKGLATTRVSLLDDEPIGGFDLVYCDGVMGHLWNPQSASVPAWTALAGFGRRGSMCIVSNDLSDDDLSTRFAVRSAPGAAFYRPPATWFARDARASGRWAVESTERYVYSRSGTPRRREIVVARLLVDEGVVTEDARELPN